MREQRIGFIGAGQMAEAIARGLIEAKIFAGAQISASDVSEARTEVFRLLGAVTTEDNREIARSCQIILLAVKPQNLPELLKEIGPSLSEEQLLISICAGASTGQLEASSSAPLRVVRAMPNLPIKLRMGATALCAGRHAGEKDMETAREIFNAGGKVVVVEEALIDAVTAISGSGPAYFYFLTEVMIEAGIREGLTEQVARELAVQTALGAAEMMATEDASAEELRRRVTSKGGTTEAAFRTMSERGIREGLLDAIHAAAARAKELGGK